MNEASGVPAWKSVPSGFIYGDRDLMNVGAEASLKLTSFLSASPSPHPVYKLLFVFPPKAQLTLLP
ncbi:hypothetical protein QM565_33585 [Geitlerinema splendidum]|nr:hypothetical protein [Geitlerinema splendidum]